MRWFQKDRPPDVWEFAADQPLGDIGAAQKIREICACAGSIVETMAALGGRKAETQKASEAERYQAAVKCALELAKQIVAALLVQKPVYSKLALNREKRICRISLPRF